jgi:hypothetical protein
MSESGPAGSTRNATRADWLQLRELIRGFTHIQLHYAAVCLGLPDLLAADPMATAELAERVDASPDRLGLLLRGLAKMDVVVDAGDRRFWLTPLGDGLRPGVAGSGHGLASLGGAEDDATLGQLPDSVRAGKPGSDLAFGPPLVDDRSAHP